MLPSRCQVGIDHESMSKLARSCDQEADDFLWILHRVQLGFLFLPPSVLVLLSTRCFAALDRPKRNGPKIDAEASTTM